ncbi:DNA (cytosine-5)-methyltransferase CMT1-like [Lolium rigidum]|uniref:DNA (cytosine-5)-methyltransferase CMT1-like n=1 Tax=Lolium rigidum TaxID=89674 RepID=UPI001F5C2E81|nr:DNA (cytosine-5)-methyltransferase CMT1-like [Lolium rigidum]
MEPPAPEPRRSARRPRTKPAYVDADAEIEPAGGKRRRRARGKGKPKQPEAAPATMVDDDDDVCASEPDEEQMRLAEEEEEAAALEAEEQANAQKLGASKRRAAPPPSATQEQPDDASESEDHFVGDPMPDDEARRRWPERYTSKVIRSPSQSQSDGEEKMSALCHYTSALVDDANFDLGDDVYVRAAPGEKDYIGRITEFFQGVDHVSYFSCRWFFRVADTVITAKLLEVGDHEHDDKRVFLSEQKDDNKIESIISKVNIIYVGPNVATQDKAQLIAKSDLYYDMSYSEAYSTFSNMPPENIGATGSETTSDISCDDDFSSKEKVIADFAAPPDAQTGTATLLDLYSGCGAMSTGLCMGAALFGLKFNRKWAVDMNPHACSSLRHNHPRTEVRNEKAENYLSLLQEWEALCKAYDVYNSNFLPRTLNDDEVDINVPLSEGTFEVEKFVDICYGDPNSTGKDGLCFKVRWKTYDSSHDSWEPLDGLRDSPECIKEFVESGYRESILPLPVLPKFPLPTHDAISRGQQVPTKFSQCLVACDETEAKNVEEALVLRDALSDLPKVGNDQPNDVMPYNSRPMTEFQRYIRLNRNAMMDDSLGDATPKKVQLFDHQPLQLNKDDYEPLFLCQGANFRDLEGVRVPDYAMSFMKGKSFKPFGRLWLDETVSTVVTRAEPHNQAILHPNQDRVLTVRENARLQGFPDYYKLDGPIKQKYIQVGNAVAIPVARALGYSLAQAYQQREFDGDQRPLFKLPGNFFPVAMVDVSRRLGGTLVTMATRPRSGHQSRAVLEPVDGAAPAELPLCDKRAFADTLSEMRR